MAWRATVIAIAAVSVPWTWCQDEREMSPGSFDATFVQISDQQRSFDQARWKRELAVVRDLGVDLVIVQFTGNERGAYDSASRAPVAALLAAAHELDIEVYLGLHADPIWPSESALERLAPPLDDAQGAVSLGALCRASPACTGWYISQEIDDETWMSPELTQALRAHVARTARTLRELAPGRKIAMAPFFTGALSPPSFASWWVEVLEPGMIDVLMLQDGVGTGRATPEVAGTYLTTLRPVLSTLDVELWSVAELFQQVHGKPIDEEPFEAVPIDAGTLQRSLAIETPLVERVVAFAVLDYMDPRRGGASQRLFDEYATKRLAAGRTYRRRTCRRRSFGSSL